jgi:hypothetical protein
VKGRLTLFQNRIAEYGRLTSGCSGSMVRTLLSGRGDR